ncbi:YqeG family HAD IIIA-type phosphatase [Turicibacter bilis]|uniref:YqeG family HAD IIIA-type phosphatase n=1 Tax=Turicibacter bilis TaxID=2735723 RepID=UPI0031BAFC80
MRRKMKFIDERHLYNWKGEIVLIHHFVADEYVKNVFQIDLEKLKNEGKRVIFTDLDNTLVGAAVKAPTPEIIEFLNQAKDLGFEVIIVSNNNKERVSYFAKDLSIKAAHHKALKPLKLKLRKILKQYNRSEVIMIGDQLMTDVLVAKRLGLYTILVEPIHLHSDENSTKFNRRLERFVVKQLKKRQLPTPPYLD